MVHERSHPKPVIRYNDGDYTSGTASSSSSSSSGTYSSPYSSAGVGYRERRYHGARSYLTRNEVHVRGHGDERRSLVVNHQQRLIYDRDEPRSSNASHGDLVYTQDRHHYRVADEGVRFVETVGRGAMGGAGGRSRGEYGLDFYGGGMEDTFKTSKKEGPKSKKRSRARKQPSSSKNNTLEYTKDVLTQQSEQSGTAAVMTSRIPTDIALKRPMDGINDLLNQTPNINYGTSGASLTFKSSSSLSSDPSSAFETDSACSGNDSDMEEDSLAFPRTTEILDLISEKACTLGTDTRTTIIRPLLTPLKKALVDKIMTDFWIIFDQQWSANVQTHTGTSSTSSRSGSQGSGRTRKTQSGSQISDESGDGKDDDFQDEDSRRPNEPGHKKLSTQSPNSGLKFSCPFRKYKPREYNHNNRRWRTCTLSSFDTIARMKGHLYRHHRCFQCERCGEICNTDELLKQHRRAYISCDRKDFEPGEGVTIAMEKQLRSRKKTSPNQTSEDRWRDIYRILFQTDDVPSPCFEAIQDESGTSSASMEFANYEEYSRQELPRIFRSALEAAVNEQAQPLEEGLRSQLVNLIQECQTQVLSGWRSQLEHSIASPPSGTDAIDRPLATQTDLRFISGAPTELLNASRLLKDGTSDSPLHDASSQIFPRKTTNPDLKEIYTSGLVTQDLTMTSVDHDKNAAGPIGSTSMDLRDYETGNFMDPRLWNETSKQCDPMNFNWMQNSTLLPENTMDDMGIAIHEDFMLSRIELPMLENYENHTTHNWQTSYV